LGSTFFVVLVTTFLFLLTLKINLPQMEMANVIAQQECMLFDLLKSLPIREKDEGIE